jgi:hypothetical protein
MNAVNSVVMCMVMMFAECAGSDGDDAQDLQDLEPINLDEVLDLVDEQSASESADGVWICRLLCLGLSSAHVALRRTRAACLVRFSAMCRAKTVTPNHKIMLLSLDHLCKAVSRWAVPRSSSPAALN